MQGQFREGREGWQQQCTCRLVPGQAVSWGLTGDRHSDGGHAGVGQHQLEPARQCSEVCCTFACCPTHNACAVGSSATSQGREVLGVLELGLTDPMQPVTPC